MHKRAAAYRAGLAVVTILGPGEDLAGAPQDVGQAFSTPLDLAIARPSLSACRAGSGDGR